MKVIDVRTGVVTIPEHVKETKCYITVDYDGLYVKFHKKKKTKDFLVLILD